MKCKEITLAQQLLCFVGQQIACWEVLRLYSFVEFNLECNFTTIPCQAGNYFLRDVIDSMLSIYEGNLSVLTLGYIYWIWYLPLLVGCLSLG